MNTRDKLDLMEQIRARNEKRVKEYMQRTDTKMCYLVEKSVDGKWPEPHDHLVIMEMKVALIMAKAMWAVEKDREHAHVTLLEAEDAQQTRVIWKDGEFTNHAYLGGEEE